MGICVKVSGKMWLLKVLLKNLFQLQLFKLHFTQLEVFENARKKDMNVLVFLMKKWQK